MGRRVRRPLGRRGAGALPTLTLTLTLPLTLTVPLTLALTANPNPKQARSYYIVPSQPGGPAGGSAPSWSSEPPMQP